MQGAHGTLHHPHRPGAGGGDAEESHGQGQQEGPPAPLLPMTGNFPARSNTAETQSNGTEPPHGKQLIL